MTSKGYLLRSGNAAGSDYNFQKGAQSVSPPHVDVYLPWTTYNIEYKKIGSSYITPSENLMEFGKGLLIDTGVLTYIDNMKQGAQKMHCRNVYQVIGHKLPRNLSKVCIYYASLDDKGNVKGGTRTAVGLSEYYDIPTFNLFVEEQREEVKRRLGLK